MLDALHIVIPVAIHQVCHQTACSLWQVIGILLDDVVEVKAMKEDDLAAIRRELEALDVLGSLGDLLAV